MIDLVKFTAVALLLGAAPVYAQAPSEPAEEDDPFAAFDDFDDEWQEEGGLTWTGFFESGYGRRLDADPNGLPRQTLGDVRARLETEWAGEALRLTFKGDLLYDDYESEMEAELRELAIQASPRSSVDLKVGRQVLTWGTGDLVFLNDLFPKNWVSFFFGREDDYLKDPSDALRLTWYTNAINVDIVWSPEFEPDNYLTGARASFFSPVAGGIVAPRPPLDARMPDDDIENGELALRLFKTVGSTEYAGYFYRGFFKQPLGSNASLEPSFPQLSVIGASLRRPLGRGLFNAEIAYHDSREDGGGTNPLIPNDQLRLLTGYEFEARPRLTVGLQWYLELTRDYAALVENSPAPSLEPDERRHVLTTRLTYRTAQDRLTYSLFAFYSPTDDDHYVRPSVSYRHSDRWTFTTGASLFSGKRDQTFFGQLEDNSNVYARARYNF
ncbi:MAG: hypothetical protein OEQ25_02805 [Gammaproteobacteria bacterium]|nr:hypothetical protein [Gammaproteobacteria bacterium]MDH3506046.1 hypothetical protein [Gammaproteobacteria bacterium]